MTNRKPKPKAKPATGPQRIFVAELDGNGRLMLASVIDAANAARQYGQATLDMEGVDADQRKARENLHSVTVSVHAIAKLHGLEFESSEPVQLGITGDKFSWVAKATLSLPGWPNR